MDTGLSRRSVVVTGASSGIGRATAITFGREGARVAITYHSNKNGAESTATAVEAAGGVALVLPLDLNDADSIRSAIGQVVAEWGGIDVLVNNAVDWDVPQWGIVQFEDIPVEQWQRMLRANTEGVFHVIQAALPSMRGRGNGRIILLSSGAAEFGMPGEAAYGAAKSALHGLARSLARSLARELGPTGIHVNVVMPGMTTTERNLAMVPEGVRDTVASQSPSGRLSTPDDVAATIVMLGSAANGNITGQIVRVSGGL